MRALKISGIVVGCLVAVVIVLLLGVWLFVNPNDYKGRIEQEVKTATGRELVLTGPIKLAVFPWIALQLGPASLGNPPGFGSEPFAAVQYVSLRVKLLPLLHKQLQIGHIEIDGLDLHLMRNAQGRGNWQSTTEANAGATPPSSSSGGETLRDVAGIALKDSRVSYQDMVLDGLNANVGQVYSGAPIPVDVKVRLTMSRAAQPIDLSGQLSLTMDDPRQQFRFAPLKLEGSLTPKAGAARVPWAFSSPSLSVDLGAQTVSAPSFTAQLGDAHLAGSLQGMHVIDAPAMTGGFKLEPVDLREWMTQMALTVPSTRDPKALSKFAASGAFTYGHNEARADKLDVQLDDSTLQGDAAITNLATKAMSFNLALDHIDLDRYLSAAPPPPAPVPASRETAAQLPTTGLRSLQLNGTATIGSATISRINVSQVRVTLAANDGVVHIAPVAAQLYGGTYSGNITLDDRGSVPVLTLDQSMTGIDVAQLLKAYDNIDRLSGRGTVTMNITGRGLTSDAVLSSLSGHVAANLADGSLQGLDLWHEINRAVALAQRHPMPAAQSTGRTSFSTFKASADLASGIATTKDLNIASGNLDVTGQGTMNLVTEAIDYKVKAAISRGAGGGGMLADIPLDVTGKLTSPTVRPDLVELAKAGVKSELNTHKQELQQKLQDKLKGLFR
jgi:AsmA protein